MKVSTIYFSFMITYIILLTTGTITFIEALRTNSPQIRHIFNLETAVSVIAGYFYSLFIAKIDIDNIDYAEISRMRYVDWAITTPIMLLVLTLVLGQNIKKHVKLLLFALILLLNYSMLLFGYLGEINILEKIEASVLGFIPFILIFYLIYKTFIKGHNSIANNVMFGLYICIWSLYGVVYMFDDELKNICFNALDLVAKCFVGLGLWAYYTKILY
jgi:bacteriorhodopsin